MLALTVASGCETYNGTKTTAHTVDHVNLELYAGKWYEIASFPAPFQEDCFCTTATYTRVQDEIQVVNACRRGSPQGSVDTAQATAYAVPCTGNAQLKVQFFWPFKGDYWVIGLDPDYRYAMVGHPAKKYLWILSRTPTMEDKKFQSLVELARSKGYAVERLRKMVQTCRD